MCIYTKYLYNKKNIYNKIINMIELHFNSKIKTHINDDERVVKNLHRRLLAWSIPGEGGIGISCINIYMIFPSQLVLKQPWHQIPL